MNQQKILNVVFLCTHNSARSILAEALLTHLGRGRFKGFSAGSSPRDKQQPNPLALEVLQKEGIAIDGLHSKSWDVFALADAPHMDLVITVCDNAREVCPIWPGQPMIAHWGSPDPAAFEGTDDETMRFFIMVASQITRRVDLFCAFSDAQLLDAVAVRSVGDQFKLAGETMMKK